MDCLVLAVFCHESLMRWIYVTRGFSLHFRNTTQPQNWEFFASFYTKFGKNSHHIIKSNKQEKIKYLVHSTSVTFTR